MSAIDATAVTATPAAKTTKSPTALILLIVLLAVVAWGASVFFFGVPGLYIPALAMVPVIYALLIIISLG